MAPEDVNPDLAALIQRLRDGSPAEAWQALATWLPQIGPVAARRLRQRFGLSAAECDDVISAALLRLFEARAHIDVARSLPGYFLAIVEHVAIARHRQRRASRSVADVEDHRALASATLGTAMQQALRQELDRLDPNDRKILEAFAGAADPLAWAVEVARDLGMTTNAVRVRKHRLLARIRARMTGGANSALASNPPEKSDDEAPGLRSPQSDR